MGKIQEAWEEYEPIARMIAFSPLPHTPELMMSEAMKGFYAGAHSALSIALSHGQQDDRGDGITMVFSMEDVSMMLDDVLEAAKEVLQMADMMADWLEGLEGGRPN